MKDKAQRAPDYRRKRMLVEIQAGPALPGLAALTAIMLLCSVIVAKTLAHMVESLEAPQAVAASQSPDQTPSVPPLHRRALSDKFLRMGVDDIATGSIRPPAGRR